MPIFELTHDILFPPCELAHKSGLLAAGGDLSPKRLIAAYRQGIFPWYSKGEPILWWSPDPRFVIFPDELKISNSMQRIIKSGRFQISYNKNFKEVIKGCKKKVRKNQEDTWIADEMIVAYCKLHKMGYAHSVEVWYKE